MDKSLKFIIIFFFILIGGLLIYIGYGVYTIADTAGEFSKSVWNKKNRIILKEYFSPDSSGKIGFYHYVAGSLGYTTVSMSLVNYDEDYPLEGNILKLADWGVDSVSWETNKKLNLYVSKGYANMESDSDKPDNKIVKNVKINFFETRDKN